MSYKQFKFNYFLEITPENILSLFLAETVIPTQYSQY